MYEKHFGLSKRPFNNHARGTDVFVGPQAAAAISGFRKALTRPDAIATVTGPAGCGKTTLVMKALEALGPSFKAFRIGRMHLSGTDAIEFLLEALGVTRLPNGAVRRFNTFRRVLSAAQGENIRIVIVVEDAIQAGTGTLAELEALTAADGGLSDGANLVLMGNEGLSARLKDPQLERVAQRTRHRQSVVPMGAAELRGYLMHSFRQAGGDLDAAFTNGAIDVLRQLSGGIPRMANNVIEAALNAAVDADTRRIDGAFLAAVGNEEFGLDVDDIPEETGEPELTVESGQPSTDAAPAETASEAGPEPEPERISAEEPAPEPVIVFSDEPMAADDEDIPELIQDTLPDLEVLSPDVADDAHESADKWAIVEDDVEPVPVGTFEPAPAPAPGVGAETIPEPEEETLPTLVVDPDDLPELEPVAGSEPQPEPIRDAVPQARAAASAGSGSADVPDWERDPTLAELRPDLDALEKAMAFAHGGAGDEAPLADDLDHSATLAGSEPEEIPEITLDHAIQERIENNLIDEPGEISPTRKEQPRDTAKSDAVPEIKLAPRQVNKKADAEIERIAAELAKAKTIEDVDDKLAETLFGEEINLIAAQVIASAAARESANDGELPLADAEPVQQAQAAGSHPGDAAGLEVSLESPAHGNEGGLDLSASQRLKTVRALNADRPPSLRAPDNDPDQGPEVPARDVVTPEPIEDQINTSMTQTLKALDVHPPTLDRERYDGDGDEDGDKKGGFFSRFRRS